MKKLTALVVTLHTSKDAKMGIFDLAIMFGEKFKIISIFKGSSPSAVAEILRKLANDLDNIKD